MNVRRSLHGERAKRIAQLETEGKIGGHYAEALNLINEMGHYLREATDQNASVHERSLSLSLALCTWETARTHIYSEMIMSNHEMDAPFNRVIVSSESVLAYVVEDLGVLEAAQQWMARFS